MGLARRQEQPIHSVGEAAARGKGLVSGVWGFEDKRRCVCFESLSTNGGWN